MPATSGLYNGNETIIYNRLIESGWSMAAACGILANLWEESRFQSNNLQNSYESKYGNDVDYTKDVDSKARPRATFIYDGAGYGVAQWTHSSRKEYLYDYCRSRGESIGDLNTQINCILSELSTVYKTLHGKLKKVSDTAEGAYEAAVYFCTDYEKPADTSTAAARRGELAKDTFWSYYYSHPPIGSAANIGNKIVKVAKDNIGSPYKAGGDNPSGFDDIGFVSYCYKEAGESIGYPVSAQECYEVVSRRGKNVKLADVRAADLLFYAKSASAVLDHTSIAIANGSGGRIYITESSMKVTESSGLGSPTSIIRVLADPETSQTEESDDSSGGSEGDTSPGISPDSYLSLTSTDIYSADMSANLSKVQAEGYDYGYLIDMTNGGDFKFYVPEFSEQAGAKWSAIEIRGRSVDVMAYDATSSRSISISLELYAGEGLYRPRSGENGLDTVSRMHKDAYFVKSLEYPDYSNVITRPPATVHLILGSAINISGVVSNVVVEHSKPVDEYNRAMYIKLSFTVTQTATNPIDYHEVRNGQYALIDTTNIYSLETGGTPSTNAPVSNITGTGTSGN